MAKYQDSDILSRYPEKSVREIAEELNISDFTVRRVLHKYNVKMRPQGHTSSAQYNKQQVLEDYKQGLPILALSKKYQVPYSTLRNFINTQSNKELVKDLRKNYARHLFEEIIWLKKLSRIVSEMYGEDYQDADLQQVIFDRQSLITKQWLDLTDLGDDEND